MINIYQMKKIKYNTSLSEQSENKEILKQDIWSSDPELSEKEIDKMVKDKINKKRKSLIMKNSIQFVIGIILLTFSFFYLQSHPAEKTSMYSWIKIIFQKIAIIFQSMLNEDWNLLDYKYNTIRNFEMLISSVEESKCDFKDYDKLVKKYESIKSMSLEDYKWVRISVDSFLISYSRAIEDKCMKKNNIR